MAKKRQTDTGGSLDDPEGKADSTSKAVWNVWH